MTPEKLVEALESCASMLHNPRGVYVLHYAKQFADFANMPSLVAKYKNPLEAQVFLGLHRQGRVKPDRASSEMKHPRAAIIVGHALWMTGQLREFSREKRCRWIGFAAGALAHCNLADFPKTHLNDARDMPFAISCAGSVEDDLHPVAHLMLGYMQGWLWAAGDRSIDDFRVMNNPDAKRTISA